MEHGKPCGRLVVARSGVTLSIFERRKRARPSKGKMNSKPDIVQSVREASADKKRVSTIAESSFPRDQLLNERTVPFWRIMKDPESPLIVWKALVIIFGLYNPRLGTSVSLELRNEDFDLVQGYIDRCSELAQEDIVWQGGSYHYKSRHGVGSSEDFSTVSDSSMSSWCLLFRRLYGNDEPGSSFKNVNSKVQESITLQLGNGDAKLVRNHILGPILKAIKSLQSENLDTYIFRYVNPGAERLEGNDSRSGYIAMLPEELISVMLYGGYIHDGRKAKEFRDLKSDMRRFLHAKSGFISQTRAISLLYMAYAELLLLLFRGSGLIRPSVRDRHVTEYHFGVEGL